LANRAFKIAEALVNLLRRSSRRSALGCSWMGVACLLTLSLWPTSARAQMVPSNRTIGLSTIGGLALSAPFKDAVEHFGAAGTAHTGFSRGGCDLGYPRLGLTLWYVGNPLLKGTPQRCMYFQEAVARNPIWRTKKGLSVGDTQSRLLRLYPHAYDTRRPGPKWSPKGSIEWNITIRCCGGGQRPALSVMVRGGRLVAIFVQMVGH
jgi:hypothetical protein